MPRSWLRLCRVKLYIYNAVDKEEAGYQTKVRMQTILQDCRIMMMIRKGVLGRKIGNAVQEDDVAVSERGWRWMYVCR